MADSCPRTGAPAASRSSCRTPARRASSRARDSMCVESIRWLSCSTPKLHHPHPRVIVPRAAGALAVDRIPERTERGDRIVGAPRWLTVWSGVVAPHRTTEEVFPALDTFGDRILLCDLLQSLNAHLGHLESDARRPSGHVERRAPSKRALTPLKERLPEPPPDAVTGVVAHQVSIGAEHSRPSNHLRELVSQRGPRLADPETVSRLSVRARDRHPSV